MTTITDRQKTILIVLLCAVFVACSFYWYKSANLNNQGIVVIDSLPIDGQSSEGNNERRDIEFENTSISDNQIYVHVKGAVHKPGVYALESSHRVIDAIEAAGGALVEGNLDLINLAARLNDGQEVIVYVSLEEQQAWAANINSMTSSQANNQSYATSNKVNINTATVQQLQTLPGIGPSKAEAIIRYREQNGAFNSIESIVHVSGIGQITFENLKDSIVTK